MLYKLLAVAMKLKATDLHIELDKEVWFRLGSDIVRGCELVTADESSGVGGNFCDESIFSQIYKACNEDSQMIDGAFSFSSIRVRVHLYKAQEIPCATLRLLYSNDLLLPQNDEGDLLRNIALLKDGLFIISGPTGSGKSFTLASCIQYINQCEAKHIVTIEDPIEFVFSNKRSLIHQRQLGRDVESMALGIKEALREDPDVIMIGELRDRLTLEAALHAAETGHLVFCTLHTQRAVMAINRMISMFPAEQQEEVRAQLSQVLRAVICQRLVRQGDQFIPVRDILINNAAVANLIRQRKEPQIVSIQEMQRPMQTMEMAVNKVRAVLGPCEQLDSLLDEL